MRAAFEAESGADLAAFFWFRVAGPGLPSPRLDEAVWTPGAQVRVGPAYHDPVTIELPLRLQFADARQCRDSEQRTERVTIQPGDSSPRLASEQRPSAIEVDPSSRPCACSGRAADAHAAGSAPPFDLVLIASEHDLAGYATAATASRSVTARPAVSSGATLRAALLERGHLLLLGGAALDDEVRGLFATEGNGLWDRGFEVASVRYVSDADAGACVRNRRLAGAFVVSLGQRGRRAPARRPAALRRRQQPAGVRPRAAVRGRDFEAIERIEVR